MKNRHYLRHILAITALLFNGEAIYSQTYPIENYLKAAGDYVTIYNGEIELTYSLAQINVEKIAKTRKHQTEYFIYGVKYYLEYNGIYYPVSNNKSFAKIFPEQHKLIKRYARKHKLNFRHDADASLIALTNFCEELIDQKQTR